MISRPPLSERRLPFAKEVSSEVRLYPTVAVNCVLAVGAMDNGSVVPLQGDPCLQGNGHHLADDKQSFSNSV